MKHTKLYKKCLFGAIALQALLVSVPSFSQIQIEEKNFTIPTYEQKDPKTLPRFYEGRGHQGVQKRMYPYAYDDGLTPNMADQDHSMIHIENEFIDLAISPKLGGRIYYADDKSNDYNYLYHNHVVKPSLIGMIGNWISGSLAWGFPHHHGPNTVESMAYTIEEGEDGSQTVWIRTWDRRHRMESLVGYTVYANSSIIEMTIHPKNRTAVSNSFLFWTNPAVHCDSTYQVIFPPSVQYVTFHGKNQMTAWPIADSFFNNYDFTGMDISMWKNTHVPSSFFSWDPRENYFGGYDHGKEAGTAWVGNRYTSPGMKYWADGNNANGEMINEGLTDADGRYIELMAGFYTDNQPDYSWLQPYETKIGKMIWFPIRELGGLLYANREGALNYFIEGDNLDFRLNATSRHENAKVLVKAAGKVVLEKTIEISPDKPAKIDVKLPAGTKENDLDLALLDENGKILLSYLPKEHDLPAYEKPEALKPFAQPEDIQSVEELYLVGLRLDQFYNATIDPMPYYEEALKRDPNNYNVNVQLGIKAIKSYDWEKAEKFFQIAVDRITANYTRPKDGEALYYLGLCQRVLGNDEKAYENLYRASWSYAWHTASYLQLASMDCINGSYPTALEHIDLSISTNTANMRAVGIKAYVLRKLNKIDEAKELLGKNLDTCKIDLMALNELHKIGESKGENTDALLVELDRLMVNDIQLHLELATEYAQIGAYDDAIEILERTVDYTNYPMVFYTLGFYNKMIGNSTKAKEYYLTAAQMPTDYCFPFRWEEVMILKDAMQTVPTDARASYYLGNLLFEHQPEEAVKLWKESLELDPTFYITSRNLAWAYSDYYKDYATALDYIKKSYAQNSKDTRVIYELDELNDLNNVSTKEKYEFLKKNFSVVKSDPDDVLKYAIRAAEYGKYQEALDIMNNNYLMEAEGSRDMQDNYTNCYSVLALNYLDKKQYDKAITNIQAALDYPIGLYGRSTYVRLYYIAGCIYKAKGDTAKDNEYFNKASEVQANRYADAEYNYYKAETLKELGKVSEAEAIFNSMLSNKKQEKDLFSQFADNDKSAGKRMAKEHYFNGLAYYGLGDIENAKAEFGKALEYNPANIWCQVFMKKCTK